MLTERPDRNRNANDLDGNHGQCNANDLDGNHGQCNANDRAEVVEDQGHVELHAYRGEEDGRRDRLEWCISREVFTSGEVILRGQSPPGPPGLWPAQRRVGLASVSGGLRRVEVVVSSEQKLPAFTRRELVRIAGGVVGLAVAGAVLWAAAWDYVRWTEDFLPGTPPTDVLEREAWVVSDDRVVFAAVGDTGTGGRNQMDIARAMVEAYKSTPYGLVAHVGDVSYRGSILDRWEDVWLRPYQSLLDAGVRFEVSLGNHELEEGQGEDTLRWIHERFEALGYDNTYRLVQYGPVDFFFLDSSTPLVTGENADDQLAWLDEKLSESAALWKIAVMHHAPYSSSAKRGSNVELRAAVEPLFTEHGVQLVLTGHDHTYERTTPQSGVTYIVTGAGAKLSDVGRSDFTAASAKILQFLMIEADGNRLHLRAIDKTGVVFDEVNLNASGEVVP